MDPKNNLRSVEYPSGQSETRDLLKSSPTILSRNTELPSLAALDAGDVVECYALTRMAKLENVGGVNSNNIMVRKSAIAFRYKPKSSSPDIVVKDPFELTLEYGPQRTGSTQSFEAMPSVNGHYRDLEYEDGDGMYVSWENHAKIYYDRSISEKDWDNAYYMAPITGAVLSKVLGDYITDYPIQYPRYQPFKVVEKGSGDTVVDSSNSEDFVWNVFKKLANMYVAIDPILAPQRYEIELVVEDASRDYEMMESSQVLSSSDIENSGGSHERKQNAANYAAEFYHKFYSCIEAIQTGDYSEFIKTDQPTLAPTAGPTNAPTVKVTGSPTVKVTGSPTTGTTDSITKDADSQKEGEGANSTNTTDESKDKYSEDDTKDISSEENDAVPEENDAAPEENDAVPEENDAAPEENDVVPEENDVSSEENDLPEENVVAPEENGDGENRKLRALGMNDVGEQIDNIESELNNEDGETSHDIDSNVLPKVDDAKEAAQEAEKAAETAQKAATEVDDEKAAEAAGVAVEAAKKAAQATSDAVDQVASESLLSGEGELMANIIQTCFTDPKYGVSEFPDEKDALPIATNVYLYDDGAHYHRLNLTSPYVRVRASLRPLPKPNLVPSGKGDVVDIGLAMAIIGAFCFGIIVMLHHTRVLQWNSRLQFKWFFHPTSKSKPKRGAYSHTPNCDTADDDSIGFDEQSVNEVELADTRT